MTLIDHAQSILAVLKNRRGKDGAITPITNTELLQICKRAPRDYAVVFGQAISLIDAACLEQDLPLLGLIVQFNRGQEEYAGPWAPWLPFRQYIEAAPCIKQWSDEDFAEIKAALRSGSVSRWWEELAMDSNIWLQRALLVTLRVGYEGRI